MRVQVVTLGGQIHNDYLRLACINISISIDLWGNRQKKTKKKQDAEICRMPCGQAISD